MVVPWKQLSYVPEIFFLLLFWEVFYAFILMVPKRAMGDDKGPFLNVNWDAVVHD